MGRLILTMVLVLGFQTCLGQFESRVPGMYMTAEIGMWNRILVLKSDSTYFFSVDTDLGGQDYIEPVAILLPTWTFAKATSSIVLNSMDDYDPKIKTLSWDTISLRSGAKKKLRIWTRVADMDSLGNILTFQQGNELIKFSPSYQPLYSE